MATHVIGKTLDVGEALRSYVEKRVVHTGEKFLATSARRPCAHREGARGVSNQLHYWLGQGSRVSAL